jgi:hypothetical protein
LKICIITHTLSLAYTKHLSISSQKSIFEYNFCLRGTTINVENLFC